MTNHDFLSISVCFSTRKTRLYPPSFFVHRLTGYRSSVKHSPPVRLKEFPKAENELRGVKSGLLGLLTGLHKPELNVTREKCNTKWMMVSVNGSLKHGFKKGRCCFNSGHLSIKHTRRRESWKQCLHPRGLEEQRVPELLLLTTSWEPRDITSYVYFLVIKDYLKTFKHRFISF